MYARKILESITLLAFVVFANAVSTNAQPQSGERTTATIINSGSTNNKDSYRIVLTRSGDAAYTREPGDKTELTKESTIHSKISMELTNKFFGHLDAAMPVSRLPEEECEKGKALGSMTYVSVDGQRSPNLSCARDQRKSALYDDITMITSTFAVKDAAPVLPGDIPPTRTITLSDDNKTVHMKVGDTFALRLGTSYTWAMAGLDQSILDQHANPTGPEGTQGVFKVASVGKSDLRAIGDPHCKSPKSSCGPVRNFKVTIVVDQQ
jgi:hypothetical protein